MKNIVGNFQVIMDLYNKILSLPKLGEEYVIVFVYNMPETMSDHLHATECIFPEERNMILSSFRKIAHNIHSYNGEEEFLKNATMLKNSYRYVMVYSMAQNIKERGRRSLIPLLCDYYGFINIGSNFISCALGRSKDIMYSILEPKGFHFPETHFIKSLDDIHRISQTLQDGEWLLKPAGESSSIGLEKLTYHPSERNKLVSKLEGYIKGYPVFCIQEFIDGEEVAVPILKMKDKFYCPGVSQVDFPTGKTYIDYDMIMLEQYGFLEYSGPLKNKLIEISANVSQTLNFTAMSRIDFRIKNNIPYIEDIGANPTISETNGVNQLYCQHLKAQPWCIYAIITYVALIEAGLFEPPFH